ncbi:inositol monophosphatase [Polychaeton citri CBS 116435]|uniref:Inositol-1-monophosphatase n=1 Tax=Polychaeton citri CBS 116435 TaxID=1314669 RepID=A0A9P4UUC2_9PEZI|nr:inositol monophosphatase [Polychaeton citri CBS 116435]
MTEPLDLDAVYSFAVQLGKDAGSMLLNAAQARYGSSGYHYSIEQKTSEVDIVTQTDQDVEAFIKHQIAMEFPSHRFIGEETYSRGTSRAYLIDHEPTWVIDPLDGTVNYTHLFPIFCVSVAFCFNGKPTIGVIYAPLLHQLLSVCHGRGAWLNENTRLLLANNPAPPPLPADAPKDCIFSCEWGEDRSDQPDSNLHCKIASFVNMAAETSGREGKGGMVHGIRSLGSAAMDLAYCAMGAFDLWWEGGCWEWDVAARICLLQEAGGLVTTANPPNDPSIAPIEDAKLGSRLYLAIRPAGDTVTETERQQQERVVRQVWGRVQQLDYARPGA